MDGMTKKELATLSGYTYRRLYDIDKSLPASRKLFVESGDGKYDPAVFVQRWVAYNVDADAEDQTLEEIKAAHEAVKMQKTELEVARMRGALVDAEEVRRLWGNVAHTVMQNMMRLPSKITPQIMGLQNADVISGIVEKEIRTVLIDISETPLPVAGARKEEDEDETSEGD